jgi:hypothetical protein
MRKFLAIFFLTLYLITATELRQLLKFPVLIEHFSEHKNQNQSITFWKFLKIHYFEDVIHDADYEKDMKLPFKSHSSCNSALTLVFLVNEVNFTIQPVNIIEERKTVSNIYALQFTACHLNTIWQPPQVC